MRKTIKRLGVLILSMTLIFATYSVAYAEPTQEELLAQYYAALAAMSSADQAAQYANIAKDNEIYAKIIALQETYPEGMAWNESSVYKTINKGRGNSGVVSACQAYAYAVQDIVFGKVKKVNTRQTYLVRNVVPANTRYTITANYYPETGDYGCWEVAGYDGSNPTVNAKFEEIYNNLRVGDIVCDSNHAMVVLSKDANGITVTEGNRGGKVHWGRRILKESLRKGLTRVESVY